MITPVIPGPTMSFKLRRLEASDLAIYRDLRLEGLRNHPEAFSSSWEQEAGMDDAWWIERLETGTVLGGFLDNSRLVGLVTLRVVDTAKLRHRGLLLGMYVRPQARGTGLAAALVRKAIEHAPPHVEKICLTVVASNLSAVRLYSKAGFAEYRRERRALRAGSDYYDEILMSLSLDAPR